MKKLLATSTILLLTFALNLFGQEVTTNGFTPNKIRPNSKATYNIKLTNLKDSVDLNDINAKLPAGLECINQSSSTFSNMSYVNGKSTNVSGKEISLVFTGEKEGEYTIGEWVATSGNQKFTIPAHTLVIDANAPITMQTQAGFGAGFGSMPSDPFDRMNQMMAMAQGRYQAQTQPQQSIDLTNFLKAKIVIPQKKIYIGESVPCEVVLEVDKETLQRTRFQNINMVAVPKEAQAFTCQKLSNNYKEDTSDPSKIKLIYDITITPSKEGTYPISYTIAGEFSNNAFFRNAYQFNETAEIDSIEVLPLPKENQPANFSGAIGDLNLGKVELDTPSASVGDLLRLSFSISGIGNFDRITAPKLESNRNWKIYEPTSEFIGSPEQSFIGTKTFTYRIVPQKPDIEGTPALEFSYFNPVKDEYFTLPIASQKTSISPASRANSIASTQESPIKDGQFDIIENTDNVNRLPTPSLFERLDFWICQVVVIALVALAIIYRRRILFLRANPASLKNIKDRRASRIHLKYAKKYAFQANPFNFFDSATKAIQFALARTKDVQANSITLKDAKRILAELGFAELDIDIYFNSLDAMNYAGAKTQDFNLMQLEKNLGDICKKLLR